jgi:IS30 family transposase
MEGKKVARAVAMLKHDEKVCIISLKEEGLSSKAITKRLGRHRASIDHLMVKTRNLLKFTIPSRKKGTGRQFKMKITLRAILKQQALKYPTIIAADLRNTVLELAAILERTIQRTLQKDLKMSSQLAAMKPLLTKKMKAKRKKFAKAHQHFTSEDWAKVMFLGESTFWCTRACRSRVRRP